MPEEMRFFFRNALHTAGIVIIYWLVSREWAGTVMLTFLLGASVFFVAAATTLRRTARRESDSPFQQTDPQGRFRGKELLRRAVGFDAVGEDPGAPLELEEGTFPNASLWPLGAALAATFVGLGFIYGPWLWIPGVSLGIATGSAWLTQPNP